MMLSSNTMLQEFGFALSVAILLDAMVVRTYIVPAAMVMMGKHAWWAPGRLQREGRSERLKRKE
jgi:RND superfamily putative drug exporter